LLVPVMAAKSADPQSGPFTYQQAVRRDDWPDFEEAAEVELSTLEDNKTWELVDEHVAMNEGAYVYDTRWVFTRKRPNVNARTADGDMPKGKAKGRLVFRGDQQNFDDFDDDDFFDDAFDEYGVIPEGDPEVGASTGASAAAHVAAQDACTDAAGATMGSKCLNVFSLLASSFGCMSRSVQNTYRQLFSPVMASTVMFILLAVACANSESIFIADVKGAFLYAFLLPDEVVYCRPPKGYENHPKFRGKIMRLRKALYGLKQAPRRWFDHLVSVFAKHGMMRTAIDPCLFIMIAGSLIVKAGTHVDDFIFIVGALVSFRIIVLDRVPAPPHALER
jgi:hypothetical protein